VPCGLGASGMSASRRNGKCTLDLRVVLGWARQGSEKSMESMRVRLRYRNGTSVSMTSVMRGPSRRRPNWIRAPPQARGARPGQRCLSAEYPGAGGHAKTRRGAGRTATEPAAKPAGGGQEPPHGAGVEGRAVFRDDRDRADFDRRVAAALGVRQIAVLRGVLRGRALLQARRLDPGRLAREAVH
jgi:hypothetical protein